MITESAVTFAVVLPTLLVAHNVADHWVQTDWQAQNKGRRDSTGREACLQHVCFYTMTTIIFVGAMWLLFDLPISPAGFLLGQSVSAVTHYWADRRFTLERLCERLGKGGFYRLGEPREVTASADPVVIPISPSVTDTVGSHPVLLRNTDGQVVKWDNHSLGTGAYALDQSWHWFWLFVAALVTAIV